MTTAHNPAATFAVLCHLATPLALCVAAVPSAASAAPPASATSRAADRARSDGEPRLDVELDPLAFGFNGFSVHAGLRVGHLRFDVGAFGAQIPSFMLGNDDFTSRFGGFGAKLDYHLSQHVGGLFIGLAASRVRHWVVHRRSRHLSDQFLHEVSLRVGYEFDLAAGLYVAPWISVGHVFGSQEVSVDGDTLAAQPAVTVFPTFHLGYRI